VASPEILKLYLAMGAKSALPPTDDMNIKAIILMV